MTGIITVFKVIFGFLGICFIGGIIFYILLDLKPWRRDSQLWDSRTDIGTMFHKSKKFAQQEIFNRNTWGHIKSYYMYYVMAIIMLAIGFSQ
jgi:hypothetical protein